MTVSFKEPRPTDPYFDNVTLLMAFDSFDPRSYEQFIRIDSNGGT